MIDGDEPVLTKDAKIACDYIEHVFMMQIACWIYIVWFNTISPYKGSRLKMLVQLLKIINRWSWHLLFAKHVMLHLRIQVLW